LGSLLKFAKVVKIHDLLTENWLWQILGDFFTNSSGHPAQNPVETFFSDENGHPPRREKIFLFQSSDFPDMESN
jgi:hypothetical protein